MKGLLTASVLLVVLVGRAAWLATDGSLADNGWTQVRDQPQDELSVRGGVLTMRCSFNRYKGTLYERAVELPEKGTFDFEARIKVTGGASDGMCVILGLGDLQISFRDDNAWRYFATPQPNWKCIGEHRMPRGQWVLVRVVWDNAVRKIRYYVGDLKVPTAVEDGVIGPVEEGARVRVGNYGLDRSPQVHELRNFRLAAGVPAEETGARELALVFRGLHFARWPLKVWTKDFAADRIVKFDLVFRGSSALPSNQMTLDGYPDEALVRRAKLIVLADLPLTEDVLPQAVQLNLLAAVKDGARMVVTGGLMGLEHSGNFGSPILKALPVRIVDCWQHPEMGGKAVSSYGKGAICVIR